MPLKIKKRDGTFEDFDPGKISRVVVAAGLEPSEADILANKVAEQARLSGKDHLSSLVIRDLVIGELHHVNENAANLFTWYEKTKDASPTTT